MSGNVSIGNEPGQGQSGAAAPDKSKKPDPTGKTFGEEGTNKTIPTPKPDNESSDELGNTPHVPKSPYTRG